MSPKIDYDALAAQHGGANYDSLATAASNPAPTANKMDLGSIGGPAALIGAGFLANAAKNKAGAAIQAARSAQLPARARAAAVKTLLKDQGPLGHIVRFIDEMDKSAPSGAGGKVPTRPINVQGKPAARAPAQTTEPSYTGGRGASGPELERRAAAMAQAKAGGPPALSLVSSEAPLEEQLAKSIQAAQALKAGGIAPSSARIRGPIPPLAGIPELELLTYLMGAQQVPQQMEDARRQYLQGAHPDLYRMLYENPNQPMPDSY